MGELSESNNLNKKLNLEHYYHVFDSAFQFIGILDTDGIVLDCNKASLSIIKESKEEILGHYFWETPWWNHNPELASKLKESIISASKGAIMRFDTTHYDYNGNTVYIDFSIKPIKDENGKVEFLIPEGRNITDIKKAYAALNISETKYRELFEKSSDASLIILNNEFVDCNKAALDMLKYPDIESFLSSHISDFSPKFQPDDSLSAIKGEEMMAIAEKNGSHRFEWIHKKSDGIPFPVEVLLTSIGKDRRSFYVIWRDITERKNNEEKIRNINIELEEKVKLRTQELEESIIKLKIAQEELIESRKLSSLGELVAGVSHEINTPIGNSVTTTTYLSKILKDLDSVFREGKLTKGEFQQTLAEIQLGNDAILTNLNWAANLVNSFKQLAVDQSSDLERDFSLLEILNDLKTSMRNVLKYNNHKIILKVDDTIKLYGDPGAYTQVFQNLIQNSLHHGFEDLNNGIIYVKAKVIENTLVITYMDNGRGISEASIDKIYNPFFTTGRAKGRTGLGMSIVHNQLMRLKGRISIVNSKESDQKPTENPGVEFKIEIPIGSLEKV